MQTTLARTHNTWQNTLNSLNINCWAHYRLLDPASGRDSIEMGQIFEVSDCFSIWKPKLFSMFEQYKSMGAEIRNWRRGVSFWMGTHIKKCISSSGLPGKNIYRWWRRDKEAYENDCKYLVIVRVVIRYIHCLDCCGYTMTLLCTR